MERKEKRLNFYDYEKNRTKETTIKNKSVYKINRIKDSNKR